MIRVINLIRNLEKQHHPLVLIGLSGLIFSLGNGAVWFLLPIMSENILKNLAMVGLIISIPNVISMLFDIPTGGLSDHIGRKKILLAGLGIMAFLGLILPTVKSMMSLMVFMIFFGLANQYVLVPARAYVMDIAPKGKTAEYFGVFTTFFQIGFMIAPFIAGYLLGETLSSAGVSNISLFYFTACLLAAVLVFLLKETVDKRETTYMAVKDLIKKDKVILKEILDYRELKTVGLMILFLTFILVAADGVIWMLEPLYYKLNVSPLTVPLLGYEMPAGATIGLILSMFVLPFILFEIPAGVIADRCGKWTTLLAGLLVAGLFFIVFGSTLNPVILMASAFLATTGLAFAHPSMEGLLTDISLKKEKGGVVGVWDVAEDLGYIMGPLVGGVVAEYYGIEVPFVFLGILILLMIPLVYVVSRKSRQLYLTG